MAQQDTVSDKFLKVWERLEKHWAPYFKEAGLNLTGLNSKNLRSRLTSPIKINFRLPGLGDLSKDCRRGIEPGDPARSLFYHVMASPNVNPVGIRKPREDNYPTVEDLEVIENYIYASANLTLDKLRQKAKKKPVAIVMFAYEYAPAADTVHRCHADLCFSRTGISRVGNRDYQYEYKARGFFPYSSDPTWVQVVPARFGAFLAVQKGGNAATFGPVDFASGDGKCKFWVPFHKLFDGTECIPGLNLKLEFEVKHRNEKIQKVHQALQARGTDTGWNAAQMQRPPFVITEDLAAFRSTDGLMIPVPHDPLIEPARTKEERLVGFPVPPAEEPGVASLWLQNDLEGRSWPEFTHVKHKIVEDKNGKQKLVYLPNVTKRDIADVVHKGGFVAANFVDWTADGYIRAHCPVLARAVHPRHPMICLAAYSILAQPDFFPLVKQQDLADWWQSSPLRRTIWSCDDEIVPTPLSAKRLPANITLNGASFDSGDTTMTAIIGSHRRSKRKCRFNPEVPKRESTLSYRASNLFEPGWDTSVDFGRDQNSSDGTLFLANYGLGSPFAEDTLICSAMGAYWPGAVPDITRFFPPGAYPTTTPLLDKEAKWPAVKHPARAGNRVKYQPLAYADFVRAIYQRRFEYSRFQALSLSEFILRTTITARFYRFLRAKKDLKNTTQSLERAEYVITSFRPVNRTDLQPLRKWKDKVDQTFLIKFGKKGKDDTSKSPGTEIVTLGPSQVVIIGPKQRAFIDPEKNKWTVENR